MPKVEREVKKAEAIRWMNILGINTDIVKLFEDQDIVMACLGAVGTFLPITDPKLEAQIREFEQKWNCLVYMVVRTPSSFGWLDYEIMLDSTKQRNGPMRRNIRKCPIS